MTWVAMQTNEEGSFRITVNEKILVHLIEYTRYQEKHEVPSEITQQGIAETVSARRSHVSMALSTLRERQMVEERTVRVIDEARRKKAYFLTPKGYNASKEIVKKFESRMVRIDGLEGKKFVKISDLPQVLEEKYYLVDVLCCITRDGILDVAKLTGQDVGEAPEKPRELKPETKKQFAYAMAVCPHCSNSVMFPYEVDNVISVVCGYCSHSFRASIGMPITQPTEIMQQRQIQDEVEKFQRQIAVNKGGVWLGFGALGAFLSSLLFFIPYAANIACLFSIFSVFPFIISIALMKGIFEKMTVALAALFMVMFLVFLFEAELILQAFTMNFLATALALSTLANIYIEDMRSKLKLGCATALIGAFLPCFSVLGTLIGFGMLVAAATILSYVTLTGDWRKEENKKVFMASWFIATLSMLTFVHWIFWPSWDLYAVAKLTIVVVPLYAFAFFAKPIDKKTRAEITTILSVFIAAFGISIALLPWLSNWGNDLAAYFLVFGIGAFYLASSIHKTDNKWPLFSVGVGLLILTVSLITVVIVWSTLTPYWFVAFALWVIVGIVLIGIYFTRSVMEKLASIRAGAFTAMGVALILAGAYMLFNDLGTEGTIEIALGTPFIGYAVFRSGAPWVPRLIMALLFAITVATTWLAFVTMSV